MEKNRPFLQVNVFSSDALYGNPLAVVLEADGLDVETMQRFAAWTNLSETTFLLPPDDASADYRVRIFTPTHEMPFAGHPTLGSCVSWLHYGGRPRDARSVRQQCPLGIVEIDIDGDMPAFAAPQARIEAMSEADANTIATALEIDPAELITGVRLENGPEWALLELASADAVLTVDAARAIEVADHSVGLLGRHEASANAHFEVRMFAPRGGIAEDPITGSLNAAIARWLDARGEFDQDLVVAQGTRLGRRGRVHMRRDPGQRDRLLLGGEVQVLVEGTVKL